MPKKNVNYKVTAVQGGVRKAGSDKFTEIIHGDYCNQVYLNDKKIWDINNDISARPSSQVPDDDLLPSDCRFRIDRGMLIANKMDEANKAKALIEELQRHDYKLRESVPLKK